MNYTGISLHIPACYQRLSAGALHKEISRKACRCQQFFLCDPLFVKCNLLRSRYNDALTVLHRLYKCAHIHRLSMVPVSSHAKPRSRICTFRLLSSRYFVMTVSMDTSQNMTLLKRMATLYSLQIISIIVKYKIFL